MAPSTRPRQQEVWCALRISIAWPGQRGY